MTLITENLGEIPTRVVHALAREIATEVSKETPIDTGAAKSSWGATLGAFDITHPEVVVSKSIADERFAVKRAGGDPPQIYDKAPIIKKVSDEAVASVSNAKEYLFDLNYLGSSAQAPQLFVEAAVERSKRKVLK